MMGSNYVFAIGQESKRLIHDIARAQRGFQLPFGIPNLIRRSVAFLDSYQRELNLPFGKIPELQYGGIDWALVCSLVYSMGGARDQRPFAIGRNCCATARIGSPGELLQQFWSERIP